MSDIDLQNSERLQAILSELLRHKLSESLELLDESLRQWRRGELNVFETHAEVLQHAARAERMAGKIARVGEYTKPMIRDAYDLGLVERAEFIDLVGVDPDEIEPSRGLDDGLSTPLKHNIVRELLGEGPILVHIDATRDGVSVPAHLSGDSKLVLRFGYNLKPNIPDLHVSHHALSGTLTFGGKPFKCILPWPAVYAVVSEADQQGMVWPEDVPRVLLQEMAKQQQVPQSGATPAVVGEAEEKPEQRRAHLKLVE